MSARLADRRTRRLVGELAYHVVLSAFGLTLLAPLLWLVSTSLKATGKEFVFPPEWIPDPVVWANYPTALTALPFHIYLKNTLIVVLLGMTGTIITASLAAYAFARIEFPLRNFWFSLLLSTLMLPGIVTLIPTFIIFKTLGLVDTLAPLWLPSWFGGGAFNVFLIRQFFMGVPYELDEAALVDGAGSFRIWWQMMLPLSKPVLATVAIFSFLGHWNEFMAPLIYLNSEMNKTLALGLNSFRGQYTSDWNLMMAASTVMIVPVLVLFFSAQRYFVQSINVSGFGGR